MKRSSLSLLCLAAIASLSGCGMMEARQEVEAAHSAAAARAREQLDRLPTSAAVPKYQAVKTTSTPWLGLTPTEAKRSKQDELPPELEGDFTFSFPDRANLSTIAERITRVTGVPVKLRPDVFIRASTLLPRSASSAQGEDSGRSLPAPPLAGGEYGLSVTPTSSDYALLANLNYTGPLAPLLDSLAAKTGTSWEYKDGAIVWFRFVTRTFTLKSTPGSSELQSSIGKTGSSTVGTSGSSGGGSSTSGTFSSDASVKMSTTFSIWENMKQSVEAMLSPVGRVAVTEATGTITVTDTREVVDTVEAMVDQVNKALTRQVAVRVEVLSVSDYKTDELGLDVNALFERYLANGNSDWHFNLTSPTSLTGTAGGGFAYSVLDPKIINSGSTQTQLMTGSALAFKALSQAGTVKVMHTASTVTLNRQPVPVAVTDQKAYVQSVSLSAATEGTDTLLSSVNTGVITTGFVLNLLPFITDDDSVLMQFSVDISSLKGMEVFGEGPSAVHTPETASMQFLQRVGLKNGQTLVLSGFERDSAQGGERSFSSKMSAYLGGSQTADRRKESIVILITPVISEGV